MTVVYNVRLKNGNLHSSTGGVTWGRKPAAIMVYLRTAVDVSPKGWAQFDMVRMPEYRWGIFLADQEVDRKINFGIHKGEDVWQEGAR